MGISGYVNPLSRIQGLQPERIDQGVDYGGSGPILALGPGTVLETSNSGWPGGAFIAVRLTGGPYAGDVYYYAENITPQVRVGDNVQAGQVLGNVHGGIEIGWAAANPLGESQARLTGQTPTSGDAGASPTAFGASFNTLLKELGAPSGIMTGGVRGTVTGNYPGGSGGAPAPVSGGGGGGINATPTSSMKWYNLFGPVSFLAGLPKDISGSASTIGDIGQNIGNLVKEIGHIASWFSWLFAPSHWLRVGAGVVGVFTFLGALYMLSKALNINPGISNLPMPMPIPV